MTSVQHKVTSLEEVKPVFIDLAIWKPQVDQAVGALQTDLGEIHSSLDRVLQ
jgi:hypothetical protein